MLSRRAALYGALVLGVLGCFVALRARIDTNIGYFLPQGESDFKVALARELSLGELSRTSVLLVETGDLERSIEASRAFEQALRAQPSVQEHLAFLEAGPPPGLEEAFWKLYRPRRLSFFADDPARARELLSDTALRDAALHLKAQLALPLSTLVSRVAPEDPTLILPRLFQRLAGSEEGLRIVEGRFVTEDGRGAILFLGTKPSATPASAQRSFQQGIARAFEGVRAEIHGRLELLQSGVGRFALRAEESMRADIQRVSIGSILGLLCFFLLLFRSLRLFFMALPVLGAGFLGGTSACLLAYGSIHGITLAFGAAMIGVSIDYAVHFHAHWTLAPDPAGAWGTYRKLWRGLALSAATTVTGFLALGASDFPGLAQMGLFAAVGVASALFASRVFLPAMVAPSRPTGLARSLARRLTSTLERPRALLVLPVTMVLAVSILGFPGLRWNDDISDLSRLDPELLAEDEAVRTRIVRYEQRRLIVALGVDEESALAANERVSAALSRARTEGALEGYRTLATLLPSAGTQLAVDATVRGDTRLGLRLEEAFANEGFRSESFAGFRDLLNTPPPPPLSYAELAGSPLASLVRAHRVSLEGFEDLRIGFVSFLAGIQDEEHLEELVGEIPDAHMIDLQATLTEAYSSFRRDMQRLLLLGLSAVLLLVLLRYRSLRPAAAAVLPAVLAAAGTLGTLSLMGRELNMLSLVALLMVVCMGVDYGVLLIENRARKETFEATLFAVFVAAISTLLGFGLLSFSQQPALSAIGASAGTGIFFSLILAPVLCRLSGLSPETAPEGQHSR